MEDKAKEEIRKIVFQMCRKSGAMTYVNEDYYNFFINLSKDQFCVIIKAIIIDRAKHLNRIAFDGSKTDEDLFKVIKDGLYLIARRILQLDPETLKLGLFEPLGEPPDEATEKRINEKIDKSDSVILDAFFDVLSHQTQGGRSIFGTV